jgi:signal transduction histidine kinase
MHDDFPERTKDILAKRVGTHCSNPQCWKLTSGPREDPAKAVNIGVAAHMTAAALGGPRYDTTLTARQRSTITNAIWLCQNCAKLIDNDPARYTVDLLRQWKALAEETALIGVSSTGAAFALQPISDLELVKAYAQCFDRPAFQDQFRQEGSMEAFDKAIEDTIVGINTGSIRTRDGHILMHTRGKVFLKDRRLRERMDVIVDLLRWIRFRYADAVKRKAITFHGDSGGATSYCIHEQELARWMDVTRTQVLQLFSEVCHHVGIHPPSLRPGQRKEFVTLSVLNSPSSSGEPRDNPAEAYQKQISRLVHELRMPLVGIRGAAELIQRTTDPEGTNELARDVVSWCMLAHRLLETSSFLGSPRRDYRFQKLLLLRDVINPAMNSMEILLKERGFDTAQIHITDLSAIPPLWLDRLSFQQVFFNILSNAVKYALPSNSLRVIVRATRTQTEHQISICDWGIGIDESELRSLFLPGFRGQQSRAMNVHGDGLGLAVAKIVVEAHGGTIGFQSLREPTEVLIHLPRSLERNSPHQRST